MTLKKYFLSDIAEILNHKRVPLNSQEREKRKGPYPYYGASGVVDFVDDYLFDGEYVLISEDGENLRSRKTPIAFKASGKFWVNNHAHIVKGIEPFLNDWIVYYFSNTDINPFLTGAVQPKLSKENLLNIPIYLPDFSEAKAITEILSSLDDKIELNNQINKNLEALAQAIFKRWFVDFEFPNKNGQPYKSSGGQMVQSELGEIPKDWSVCTFSNSVEAIRGLSYKGAGLVGEGEGIPMHNLNSVYEGGGYKYEGLKYYSGEFKEHHRIDPWDLIVTNTEQGHKYLLIGYPAFVPKAMGANGIFSHHIYKVKALPDSGITNQFLLYLIMTPNVRDQIIGSANGTTVNMLKIDGIQRPKFVKPNRESIHLFTNLISDIWEQLENSHLQNVNLAKLRDALLPKLVSGKITVREKTKMTAS